MNRNLVFLLVLASSVSLAQSGASVCGSLLTSGDRASCIGIINGHTVDPGAAGVCGSLLTSQDRIDCLQASLDKQYATDELGVCGSLLTSQDRVTCMRNAGRLPAPPPRARDRDDDEEDRRDRRRRRRDDDDEATITFENRTRRVRATRFYWRDPGARRWTVLSKEKLRPDDTLEVTLPLGRYELCVESDDGRHGVWPNVRLDRQGYLAWFDQAGLTDGDCR